jgi:acyl-CoA synthetase (NDP forming)/RimJ/RimL family protein N-acetyltransferase
MGTNSDGTAAVPAPGESRYPTQWEADVVLADGATAHLRPIRPQDAEALVRFHAEQSERSVYLRFFAPIPTLPEQTVRRFTHVDHRDRVALVATVASRIVGIASYDRIDRATAEAALTISDAHHDRGLASVLLEHLTAAARENGIERFVADVLPENRKMLGVLRDTGYEIARRYDNGVISLGFAIDPTERSLAVVEAREHRSEAVSMQGLLDPTSVVLFGASRQEGTIGHRALQNLLAGRFTGDLHLVHPRADEVLGLPTHPTLAAVPGRVDLAVIAVPAAGVLDVVEQCAANGVRGLIVASGGFAEEGPQGAARQRELVRTARANGMRVIGPNSWGVVNADPAVRLNVSLMPALPTTGRIGLFTQSAASSVLVLNTLIERGLGASTFISAGNRADVSGNDSLQYWESDPRTDVVGMCLESIGNPRKFFRIARRLGRRKPVIVVRPGHAGFGAPPGHAVRQSRAPREALDALLTQSGCIRVETVWQMFDVAELLTSQPLPAGPRVAIIVDTPGLGALLVDACTEAGLQPRPPVVLSVVATPGQFRAAIQAAFGAEDVDSVIAAFVPPLTTLAADLTDMLRQVSGTGRQPVVATFLGTPGVRHNRRHTRAVPIYDTPEDAVRALALATRHHTWKVGDQGTPLHPDARPKDAQALIDQELRRHPDGVELAPDVTDTLLDLYGIRVWPALPVTDRHSAVEAATRLGWPVALKATAPQLRHRADLGTVRPGIAGPTELADQLTALRNAMPTTGPQDLVVQRMAPAGVACVVRSIEDALIGPVVSFGVGGDAGELLGDLAHRIPPLTDVDVAGMVSSVRAAPRLFGYRGLPPADVAALHDLIARVGRLALNHPEVTALELNPVVVAEQSLAVLGATIRLAPDPRRTDTGIQQLTPE